MKVAIVDTCYPEFLAGVEPRLAGLGSAAGHEVVMQECFGTFDAWSRNLRAIGVDAFDVIGNSELLARAWCAENGVDYPGTVATAEAIIARQDPDVVLVQDDV